MQEYNNKSTQNSLVLIHYNVLLYVLRIQLPVRFVYCFINLTPSYSTDARSLGP